MHDLAMTSVSDAIGASGRKRWLGCNRDTLFAMSVIMSMITTAEVVPGVFVSEFLLLVAGAVSALRLVSDSRSEAGFPFHWSLGVLVLGIACASLSLLLVPGGSHDVRAFISHWGLRIGLILATLLIVRDSVRFWDVLSESAAAVIVGYALVVCMLVLWTRDAAILRRSPGASLAGLEWVRSLTGIGEGSAGRIARVVMVLLPMAVWGHRRQLWKVAGLLCCAGLVVVLCRSRVGVLLFGLQLPAMAILVVPPRKAAREFSLLALIVFGALGLRELASRMGSAGVGDSPVRAGLLEASIPLILDRPLLGHGGGRATELVNRNPDFQTVLEQAGITHEIIMHNHWLSLAVEYGVPAASLYVLGLIVLIIDGALLGARSSGSRRELVFALVISVSTVFAAMQFALIQRESVVWIAIGSMVGVLGGVSAADARRKAVGAVVGGRPAF